jgi:hypothetical protein
MKWIFAFFLMIGVAGAQSQIPKKATQPAAEATTQSVRDHISDVQQNKAAEPTKWTDPTVWPSYLFSLLLVGVSAGQLIVYYKQKNIMQESLVAAKTAALATKVAAEATRTAADAAVLSAKVSLGAQLPKLMLFHLDFASMGAANWDAILESPIFDVGIKNYGGTIAFLESRGLELFYDIALPPEPDYSPHAYDVEPENVIDSQGIYALTNKDYRPRISPDDVKAIKNERQFLWVYGYVQYKDFLGERHILRFCKQLIPSRMKVGSYVFTEFGVPSAYLESA